MNPQEKLNQYKQKFAAYKNFIARLSQEGNDLIPKINAKSDYINKLTEDQRIQFINNDADFQKLGEISSKLQAAFAQFYNFIYENTASELDLQTKAGSPAQQTNTVEAPEGYEDVD